MSKLSWTNNERSWEVVPLKKLFTFEKGKNAALYTKEYTYDNPGEYPVYSGQTENNGVMGLIDTFDYELNECLFTTTVGAKVMTVSHLKGKFSLSQNCLIMLPKNEGYNIRFYYYQLMCLFNYEKALIPSHMQPSLRMEDLKKYKVLSPTSNIQDKIVSYLDNMVIRIDKLIKDKGILINLLEQQRQLYITQAVTKGLNPNVKMKDSGVEWIGEIPEHWEKKKMKYIGVAVTGLTYSPEDLTDENGTIVLRSTNIQKGKISLHDNVYVDKEIPSKLLTKKKDILICSRNGSRHLIGKNALIESEINLSFGAFTTVFRSEINDFIYFVLNSNFFEAQLGTYLTSTINQLTIGNLNNMDIVLPPREEQIDIVNYLREIMDNFNGLLKKIGNQIEKLKVYRQALIYEAVTGKIDVQDMELD